MSDSKPGTLNPDDDGINIKLILGVGVVSLTVFVISAIIALVAVRSHDRQTDEDGRIAPGKLIGQAEIGIVDQPEFSNDTRLEAWKAAKQKHLTSYGWVDRQRGFIHIPIDRAMEKIISQAAQPSGTTP